MLTNLDHNKQWFNTLISPSHGSPWCLPQLQRTEEA